MIIIISIIKIRVQNQFWSFQTIGIALVPNDWPQPWLLQRWFRFRIEFLNNRFYHQKDFLDMSDRACLASRLWESQAFVKRAQICTTFSHFSIFLRYKIEKGLKAVQIYPIFTKAWEKKYFFLCSNFWKKKLQKPWIELYWILHYLVYFTKVSNQRNVWYRAT